MGKNLEIVQKSYACGKDGDIPGLVADLAEFGSWTEMEGAPYGGTYIGPREVLEQVFDPMGRAWDPFACQPEEFVECGDTVVMTGWYFGKHRRTQKEFRCRVAHVWKLKDGKIVHFEQFTDTRVIAEAMEE